MPSAPDDDLAARVSLLEQEVVRLREQVALAGTDASAARLLAGGADRDVSEVRAELRAHTQTLNALRETQREQGDTITELSTTVTELRTEMREGFATVHAGVAQITALLGGIEGSGPE